MGFNKLTPNVGKGLKQETASASIQCNRFGVSSIRLILSKALSDKFGGPGRCEVSAGDGDDEGLLLIERTKDGAFGVSASARGCTRIHLPCGPGVPLKPTKIEYCTLKVSRPDRLLLELPIGKWAAQPAGVAVNNGGRKVEPPTPPPAPPVPPPPASPSAGGSRVDMVEYLRNKGVKISRLAEGRFSVDGDTRTVGQVLAMVNKKREAADLDPLTHSQVV